MSFKILVILALDKGLTWLASALSNSEDSFLRLNFFSLSTSSKVYSVYFLPPSNSVKKTPSLFSSFDLSLLFNFSFLVLIIGMVENR